MSTTIPPKGRSESSGRSPRLVALWEHPLGDVFGTGDGRRAVMLTMLDPRLGPTDEDLATCRACVAEVGKLDATRVCRVVDVRRTGDGRIVLTTPLLEGLSLGEVVESGRLGAARVVAILRQLCHALRPLHRAGLSHGAITVASVILVTDEGRKDAVRLVDVGVGPLFDGRNADRPSAPLQPITPEHGYGGTLDARSDIYALGALAYTMLTGKPPFSGSTATDLAKAHAEERPPELTGAGIALAPIVTRCLAKDPAERFDSLDALETALCQAQVDASITTVWDDLPRPPGAPPPPQKTRSTKMAVRPARRPAAAGEQSPAKTIGVPRKPWQTPAAVNATTKSPETGSDTVVGKTSTRPSSSASGRPSSWASIKPLPKISTKPSPAASTASARSTKKVPPPPTTASGSTARTTTAAASTAKERLSADGSTTKKPPDESTAKLAANTAGEPTRDAQVARPAAVESKKTPRAKSDAPTPKPAAMESEEASQGGEKMEADGPREDGQSATTEDGDETNGVVAFPDRDRTPQQDSKAEEEAATRPCEEAESLAGARSTKSEPRPSRTPVYGAAAAVVLALVGWIALGGDEEPVPGQHTSSSSGASPPSSPSPAKPTRKTGAVAQAERAIAGESERAASRPATATGEGPTKAEPPPSEDPALVPAEVPANSDAAAGTGTGAEDPDLVSEAALETDGTGGETEGAPEEDEESDEPAVPTESATKLASKGKQARAGGKMKEALYHFRRALAKDSRNLTSLEGLGVIYFNKGDYKKAAHYTKRAAALSPNNVEYRMRLGDAYYKLGRFEDARKQYQRAAQRGYGPAKRRLKKVDQKLAG